VNSLSRVLSAARALLDLKVKTVATAARMSDKTITQLENDADPLDNRTTKLIDLYQDLGLRFERNAKEIIGVSLSPSLRRLTFSFVGAANPDDRISRLKNILRNVSGIVWMPYVVSTDTALNYDTVDVHFPIETRELIAKLLARWIADEGKFNQVLPDGKVIAVTPDNVFAIINGETQKPT
jgi:hypothetical protein